MSSENEKLCSDFQQDIWLSLDQDLSDEKQPIWQQHLRTCSECRSRLQALQKTLKVYDNLPLPELPLEKLQEAVQHATRGARRPVSIRKLPGRYKVAATTVALAAAVALFFLLPRGQNTANSLVWNDFSMDSSISEIDSSVAYLSSTDHWTAVFEENGLDDDFDSRIYELQNRLRLLEEDLQISMSR
ncbi:MAG: anti-sigma factor family protein [bacterium]